MEFLIQWLVKIFKIIKRNQQLIKYKMWIFLEIQIPSQKNLI